MMRILAVIINLLTGVALLATACSAATQGPKDELPSPRAAMGETEETVLRERAYRLYELAHKANSGLRWDDCLAERAFRRARTMVKRHYFAHKDPRTGVKPAWYLVASCYRCKFAGENLARGDEPPELLHEALMKSPTHRKNIMDSKFRLLGVGCFEDVCVQLYAGF
jgi:uncharacterized protein YkwD